MSPHIEPVTPSPIIPSHELHATSSASADSPGSEDIVEILDSVAEDDSDEFAPATDSLGKLETPLS